MGGAPHYSSFVSLIPKQNSSNKLIETMTQLNEE